MAARCDLLLRGRTSSGDGFFPLLSLSRGRHREQWFYGGGSTVLGVAQFTRACQCAQADAPSEVLLTKVNNMIHSLPHRTQRLALRVLRASDLEAFLAYRNRADVAELQGWSPMSEGDAIAFLRNEATDAPLESGSWRQIGIAMAAGDDLIGDIGIHLDADQRTAEFGLSLHPSRQGFGLGTEAVQALIPLLFLNTGVNQVIAVTDARNTACIRLLEKSGMCHSATRTAHYKGEQCAELVFTRSRGEVS